MNPSLAAERTALAWRRTALGLVGGSVAAGRLLSQTWGPAAWAVAVAGTTCAVLLLQAARRRRAGARRTPPGGAGAGVARDPGGRLVTVCAVTLVLLGLCAVALVG